MANYETQGLVCRKTSDAGTKYYLGMLCCVPRYVPQNVVILLALSARAPFLLVVLGSSLLAACLLLHCGSEPFFLRSNAAINVGASSRRGKNPEPGQFSYCCGRRRYSRVAASRRLIGSIDHVVFFSAPWRHFCLINFESQGLTLRPIAVAEPHTTPTPPRRLNNNKDKL